MDSSQLSIRKFLFFTFLVTFITTIFLTVVGTYFFGHYEISKGLDTLLEQVGVILRKCIKKNNIINISPKSQHNKNATMEPTERYLLQIWPPESRDKPLFKSDNNSPDIPPSMQAGFSTRLIQGEGWRVLTDPVKDDFTVVIAENERLRNTLVYDLMVDDIYLILFIYPFSALIVWLIVLYCLKIIHSFVREVAQRAADHLEPLDSQLVPIEITPLIDELNKLFVRLQQAFEREQRFSSDAAHELHTPLAALRTQAQVSLKTLDPKERETQLQEVIAGVDRCTHIVQQLLTLCRLSPETVTPDCFTQLDLAKIAAEAIAQLIPKAINKHIDVELIPQPDCLLQGNYTGLYALIRNLVDNAIHYSYEGGAVKVFTYNKLKMVVLEVIDNGPGIADELRPRVFERFFRILGTHTQGSGLGLAIVEQITKLHGGSVELSIPTIGTGLQITVTLPKTGTLPLKR